MCLCVRIVRISEVVVTTMEGVNVEGGQAEQPAQPVERLNQAVQQQLNLESVKTRAISLFKAVSRILDEFDAIARSNSLPKWYPSIYLYVYRCNSGVCI